MPPTQEEKDKRISAKQAWSNGFIIGMVIGFIAATMFLTLIIK